MSFKFFSHSGNISSQLPVSVILSSKPGFIAMGIPGELDLYCCFPDAASDSLQIQALGLNISWCKCHPADHKATNPFPLRLQVCQLIPSLGTQICSSRTQWWIINLTWYVMPVNAPELPSQMIHNPSLSLEYKALFLLQQLPKLMFAASCTKINWVTIFLARIWLACKDTSLL